MFGFLANIFYIPSNIYLTDNEDFQSSSSFKILKQTVPDGYTFGWGKTGLN